MVECCGPALSTGLGGGSARFKGALASHFLCSLPVHLLHEGLLGPKHCFDIWQIPPE